MPLLDQAISLLESLQGPQIPDDIRTKTKELIADYVGVLLAASSNESAKQLLCAIGTQRISHDDALSCWLGTVSRSLDLDDGHRFAMGHPGVTIQSAVWAYILSNDNHISGLKIIESLVQGYEMYGYLGRCINPSSYLLRGFDATAICGAPAAAVAVSNLMGLSSQGKKQAVALASTLCGGLNQAAIDGSMQKYILAGWAAQLGIMAARFAQANIDGPTHALEGRLGFCNAFSPAPNYTYLNSPQIRNEILLVYTKKYSCVRRIHTQLDIVEQIMHEHRLNASDIKSIDVYGGEFLKQAAGYTPRNVAQAQTCIPYALALLIYYGNVTETLIENNIHNSIIHELSLKIKVHVDSEYVRLAQEDKSLWGAARIIVNTNHNQIYIGESKYPRGEFENPFSKEELRRKFFTLSTKVGNTNLADELWQSIASLEQIQNINRHNFPLLSAMQIPCVS